MSESPPGSEPGMQVASPECRQVFGTDATTRRIYFPAEVVSPPVAAAEAEAPSPPATSRDEAPGGEPDEKVAVLVCHGMGQQVPFEHIDMIATAIHREAGLPAESGVRVKFATLGDQRLPRAEIDLTVGGRKRRIDVYEAYWAPLTEGKVSAFAVTRFLFDAGFRGIEYALRGSFDRWMMGGWHKFPLGVGTFGLLVAAFTVICSALLLYGALGLLAGLRAGEILFGGAIYPATIVDLSGRLTGDLLRSPLLLSLPLLPALAAVWALRMLRGKLPYRATAIVLAGAGLAWAVWAGYGFLLLGALLGAGALAAAGTLVWRGRRARTIVSFGGATAVAVWTVYAAVTVSVDALRALLPEAPALATLNRSLELLPGGALPALGGSPAFQLFFLVSALILCLRIRSFYIQFLGDVAVYLSSHTLNEFDDLRGQIRKIGREVGCAIYGARAKDSGKHEYEGVVVVGHSLGSVVAYDTLNAVLNHDMTLREQLPRGAKGLEAEDRTLRLITFGSPLDKSAFIFRTQKDRSQIREGLAAAVQPLIEREGGKREIPWINIYSSMDPISGKIEYYDPPLPEGEAPTSPPAPHRVNNKADREAVVFGQAHTAYWTNPLLAGELLAAVTDRLKVHQ